jgi:hypothetical protein
VTSNESAAEATLVCAEFGRTSLDDARSWRAYLDDEDKTVTFCPECAEREFRQQLTGPISHRSRTP